MKILLLGDFSGFHVNLAYGLRELGNQVTIASDGDSWKNFNRDIDLKQPDKYKRIRFANKLIKSLPQLCGYDIVQLIQPNFLNTNPTVNRLFFNILKSRNNKLFLGANGADYYYCKYAIDGNLKYSVYQVPELENDSYIKGLYTHVQNKKLVSQNIHIANHVSGITACGVGYYKAYLNSFPDKTIFIPFPLNTDKYSYKSTITKNTQKIRFFLGKMKGREVRKGTDVIEKVLTRLKEKYPNDVDLTIANSIPFKEYEKLLNQSHILCDQLYAYGIGMNGIIAQTKGLIACGGADEEIYQLMGEYENRPIIDLNMSEPDMLKNLENLIANKNDLQELSIKSREFAVKHYNHIKVAQEYLDFWKKMK